MGRISKKSEKIDTKPEETTSRQNRKILTANEIKDLIKKNDWLIRSASPYINTLSKYVSPEGCSVFITETEGYIINLATDEKRMLEYKKNFIIPGAVPSTNSALENSVNQVVYDGKTLGEYTGKSLIASTKESCTCWTIPIMLNAQQLVGTLSLCTKKGNENKHHPTLLRLCNHCIEQDLMLSEEKSQAKMLLDEQLNIFNKHAQADLIVTGNGTIDLISDKACELLGLTRANILHKKITSIIPSWNDIPIPSSRSKEVNGIEVEIENVPHAGIFLLNAKVLKQSSSVVDEIVCSLRSIKQSLNEANKYIGNRAIFTFDDVQSISAPMKRIMKEAKSIAQTDMHVTIFGERFTGKKIIAEAIHNQSKRADMGFVRVDISNLNDDEMAEAIWGYTGMHKPYKRRVGMPGALEFANGGTLYINEIGKLPLALQDKLLEAIRTQKVKRLGSKSSSIVDVRIIASNSYDLSSQIDRGEFRIDLFYALSESSLRVPPLRDRKQDIPSLLEQFIDCKSKEMGMKAPKIPKKIILILKRYEWPNNFKEMKELAELLIKDQGKMFKTFKNEREFKRNHLYLDYQKEIDSIIPLEEVEKESIIRAYRALNGSISKASRRLGVSRNTLYLKLKKYGIDGE